MREKKQYEPPAFKVVCLEVKAQILGACNTSNPASDAYVPPVACGTGLSSCQK